MRRLSVLAAAAAVAFGLAAADAEAARDARIVVVTHGQAADPFWSVVKNGVDAAQKDMGVTVEYRAPETFDNGAHGPTHRCRGRLEARRPRGVAA